MWMLKESTPQTRQSSGTSCGFFSFADLKFPGGQTDSLNRRNCDEQLSKVSWQTLYLARRRKKKKQEYLDRPSVNDVFLVYVFIGVGYNVDDSLLKENVFSCSW